MKNLIPSLLVGIGAKNATDYVSSNTIYQFTVTDIDGQQVALSDYAGKVLLIVNVASKCGFTPQYTALEQIYQKYQQQGLIVLGFPANDFGAQEPGTEAEIKSFCQLNYQVSFPLFKKITVKGDGIHPLFQFLTEQANPGLAGPVMWNFEKFLINRQGQLIERYRSLTKPDADKITKMIDIALAEP